MRLGNRLKLFFVTPILVFGMAACHQHNESSHQEEGEEHGHEHGADEIVLEPHDAERMGVEVDTVKASAFIETLKVSGEIMPSSADRGVAAAPTTGVVRLAPGINPGSQVRAGQAIAHVTATNISGGDANTAARVAVENAKRELDRITPLLADGLVTRKEYNDALAAYESAKAAYSPAAASGTVTAPRSGVITAINIGDGEFVTTGQAVATVAANSSLTLRALVPAAKAEFLPRVNGAIMSFHDGRAIDLNDYKGKLLSSASASGGATPGYVPVFFSFDGTAPVVPGSATEVYLKGSSREGVISLPLDAIVEQMGTKFVFVRHGDHVYVKKPVKIANSDGIRVEITEGIQPGEVAVVKGATFVRLAEQATVAPEGHSHNH